MTPSVPAAGSCIMHRRQRHTFCSQPPSALLFLLISLQVCITGCKTVKRAFTGNGTPVAQAVSVPVPVLDERSYTVAAQWEQAKRDHLTRVAGETADAAAERIGIGTRCRELTDVYYGAWDATRDSADRHQVKVKHYVLTRERLALEGRHVYSECSRRQLDFFLNGCGPDTPVLNRMLLHHLRGLDATAYLHEGGTRADADAGTALNSVLPARITEVLRSVPRLSRVASRKKAGTQAEIEEQVRDVVASYLRGCAPSPIVTLSTDRSDYYVMPDQLNDPDAYDRALLELLRCHALMNLHSSLCRETTALMQANLAYENVGDWIDVHRGMWDGLVGKAVSKTLGTQQKKMQGYFAKYLISPEEFSSFIADVQGAAQENLKQHANYYMANAESPPFPRLTDADPASRETEKADAAGRFLSQLGPIPDLPSDKFGVVVDVLDATDAAVTVTAVIVAASTAAAPETAGVSLAVGAVVISVVSVPLGVYDAWRTEQIVVRAQESYQQAFGSKLVLCYDDNSATWRGLFVPCADYTVRHLHSLAPSNTTVGAADD